PGAEKPDHWHRRLLRARRQWPRRHRAAEQRDELAPPHSITSSARPEATACDEPPQPLRASLSQNNPVNCCFLDKPALLWTNLATTGAAICALMSTRT